MPSRAPYPTLMATHVVFQTSLCDTIVPKEYLPASHVYNCKTIGIASTMHTTYVHDDRYIPIG